MSGPQGSDPTQQWQGSQPPSDPAAWQQPADPTAVAPGWGQQPAYDPQQYQGYQQPAASYPPAQGYPAADQYGQSPTAYGPASYTPPTQYGQQPGQYDAAQATQYGQPAQYGQQPGQYGQPQQYGQYPQPGDPQQYSPYSTEAPKKKQLGLILGIGAALAVVLIALLVTAFVWPGFATSTELDVNAANTGVQQILSDTENGYGAKNVENVTCNGGKNPPVSKGGTFTCDVDIDGTKREVTVTFQNDDGTYEVGRPR